MSETIKDARGRSIEVKEVLGSAKSRLHMAMGRELTDSFWSAESLARAIVRSIDGRPMPPLPTTLEQVHALWDVVDDDAANAAAEWIGARSRETLAAAGESTPPQAS